MNNENKKIMQHFKKRGNRMFFYGPPKIGLTTFSKGFTNPEYVCFFNPHIADLSEKAYNIENISELGIVIKEALQNDIPTTYIFDNLSGLEDIIAAHISKKMEVPHINAKEYGIGFFEATVLFKKLLLKFDLLSEKGHSLVFLGHSTALPYKMIDKDIIRHIPKTYLKNHKGEDVSDLLCNWVDGIFYVNHPENYDASIHKIQIPLCFSFPSCFWLAGNRFGIKEVLSLEAKSIEFNIKHNNGH